MKKEKLNCLLFPVETMACLTDGKEDFKDEEYFDHTAEMGMQKDIVSLLIWVILLIVFLVVGFVMKFKRIHFSYTLGAGGVATGSKSVMTININRAVQFAVKNGWNIFGLYSWISSESSIFSTCL